MADHDAHSNFPLDDAEDHLPARAEYTPSSTDQLTPSSGAPSSEDGHGNTAKNVIGRGHDLRKLQTNLHKGEEDEEEQNSTPWPGTTESAAFRTFREEDRFRDELDAEDGPVTAYSRAYTADEERRVVKKFDRRLTLLMSFLYMLSFLDRSSE